MMTPREFLATVLPEAGHLIVATPFQVADDKTVWWNVSVPTLDLALEQLNTWVWEQRDTYFAMASFRKDRVWNPTKKNQKTGELGAYEKRTRANVQSMRSFFIDIDAKQDGKHYETQADAVLALRDFCEGVGLPRPMLVSSGYGIHAYWTLDTALDVEEWQPHADKLKSICISRKLIADHNVTADAARVLRPIGSFNFKRGGVVPVRLLAPAPAVSIDLFGAALDAYVRENNVPKTPRTRRVGGRAGNTPPSVLGDNIGATNDPLNPDLLTFVCPAFAQQVATRGANAREPLWYASLGLAKFCEPSEPVMVAVSDGHPDFDIEAMRAKAANWTGGPPTCHTFWKDDPATCEACLNWQRIKSPAERAHTIRIVPEQVPVPPTALAAPEPVEAPAVGRPKMPRNYSRVKDEDGHIMIGVVTRNADGDEIKEVVCPVDLYPRRILRQTGDDDNIEESGVWVAQLPRIGEVEIKIPQSVLSDTRKLHALLLSRGLHLNATEAKNTQFYMSAYLKQLAREADRDRVYDRLGWHDKYTSFVTPNMVYFRDGSVMPHAPSKEMRAITKDAFHTEGTLERWHEALKFYAGDGNEAYRMFIYCAFGGMLLHMTGQKGLLVAASGDTGRGKTTLLEACASVWGVPDALLIGGGQDGATLNALWTILATNHSIPMLWDDTTERDPQEMRKFMLHISTGKGKERMHGNTHDGRVATWETMVLSSANTDDVHRVMSTGKDSDPHLMRLLSIEFDNVDRSTETKLRADTFKRMIRLNYGHAGPLFIQNIITRYDEVVAAVQKMVNAVDNAIMAESQERYFTAGIAAAYVGGSIAHQLGLIPFSPVHDIEWIKAHVTKMRDTHMQAASTSAEILSEFIDTNQAGTLTVSPKSASNVDNVAHTPRGSLIIRHEFDNQLLYISRTAFNDYCTENKANFRKIEQELVSQGVILRRNCHKILGADTQYAAGQVRCWEISMAKLATIVK